jgi:rhamnulokinase
MVPDFFHWCLCGKRASEFTEATTSQLFHPVKRAWSSTLLGKLGLPEKIFPPAVMPGDLLGTLLPPVAERTGLGPIKVIAPASHDTASAVAAAPTANTGRGNWAFLSSGTWSLMGVELAEFQLSERVLELNFTNEGGVDGKCLLLKNIMGLWLVQQSRRSFERRGKTLDYSTLVELAKAEPALRSLVNPNDPRFLNPPDMPDAIREFCRETGQPTPESEGAVVRCVMESLALKYQQVLERLEEIGGSRIEAIHIIGGGARNELLNQFAADACGRAVVAGPEEATAFGNLLVQARAAGEFGSLAELREIVRRSSSVREFQPNAANSAMWQEARGRFGKFSLRA